MLPIPSASKREREQESRGHPTALRVRRVFDLDVGTMDGSLDDDMWEVADAAVASGDDPSSYFAYDF